MARVVKLPSGLIFRDRESIGRRVTTKGTPAGVKGQFGAKAIGQFIDLADKVVSSKAIGSVTSAVERGFEDTPEQAKAKLKKEAAEKRAKAKTSAAPPPPPPPPEGAVPGVDDVPRVGPVKVAPKSEPSLKEKMLAVQEKRAAAKAEADAKATEEQAAKVAALSKAEPAARPTREPERGKTPAGRDPRVVKRSIEEDAVVERTRHIAGVGDPDRKAALPAPVPLPAPVTPAVDLPQAATSAVPAGGPATTRAPQPGPPGVSPVRGQKEPVVESKPPHRPAPEKKTTIRGKMKAQIAENQEAARALVGNIKEDIDRDRPVDGATINAYAFDVANKDAVNAASFLAEYVKAFDKLGLSKQPQAAINIPKTISAEALIGYAKMASSSANQQRVLEAFANNTVTGMGYTTLAERLSGSYRKPYLNAILSSFPKPVKAKDPIDAIYKATLAYQSGMGGRLKSQQEQMGFVGAEIAGKRARTAATGAQAQLTAEQAVTERELRYAKRNVLVAKSLRTLMDPTLIKLVGLRKRGGRRRIKVNIPVLQKETTGQITQHMIYVEKEKNKLENLITKADANKDAIPELEAKFNESLPGGPVRAGIGKQLSEARRSAATLSRLQKHRDKLDNLHEDLAGRRKTASRVIKVLALGKRPTRQQIKELGLTTQTLKDLHIPDLPHRRRRKRRKKADPLKLRE